jgi:hypothetical protein
MEKRLTKDEAKEKLRRAESDLRVAKIVSEEHEKAIKEIKENIEKLKAIINKKNNWRFVEVPDKWQELYEEKALLMEDMMHFAYVRNEGWVPNWGDDEQDKYGLSISNNREIYSISYYVHNCFLFGIAVKSEKIAREMLVEFGGRIKEIYNKQY